MNQPLKLKIYEPEEKALTTINVKNFQVWFEQTQVLKGIDIAFQKNKVNCIIGPSGSGKSTLIRGLNRINDGVKGYQCKGEVYFEGHDILKRNVDVTRLRSEIGMVFQKPCVFPKSIAENVLFGVQQISQLSKHAKAQLVEDCLKSVALWKEVSHRLQDKATSLSIGQQQRLCIARTLAVKPKVILLDEPTSALDPVSTRAIENLLLKLKEKYTLIFVTHNIQQAKRISDYLIFMCEGKVIEQGPKQKIFCQPEKKKTQQYLNEEYCDC